MRNVFLCSVLAVAALPLLAHHAFEAEYDADKVANITGYVTKVDWINPHAYIFLNVPAQDGSTKEIRFELGPPYALTRGGWKRDTVKIGDKITLQNAALGKEGRPWAGAMPTTKILTATGENLITR